MNMELSNLVWRKATRSMNASNCVELAGLTHVVAVRDSKDPNGPVLLLTPATLRTALQEATPPTT